MRWTLHRIRIAEIVIEMNDEFSPVVIFNKARNSRYSISFKSVTDALEFLEKKSILEVKIIKLGSKEVKRYKKVMPNDKIDKIMKDAAFRGG